MHNALQERAINELTAAREADAARRRHVEQDLEGARAELRGRPIATISTPRVLGPSTAAAELTAELAEQER